MKKTHPHQNINSNKKRYVAPTLEHIALDTEISLVMTSPPPPNPQMPQIPGGWVEKVFKF